jgi:molybdopterin-containing oxidoreductase family iron-sulfur binding subunit
MVIDLDRCTGCQACSLACRSENNVPFCGEHNAARGRAIFWNKVLAIPGGGEHAASGHGAEPDPQAQGQGSPENEPSRRPPRLRLLPLPCMHCDNSPCTKLCPVRATFRGVDGIVMQVPSRCIGCRLCQAGCPYSRRYFNWQPPQYPEELGQALNPDVSLRTLGVIEKCTFCVHRLQEARERARAEKRAMREGDYQPACVEACPAKARTFGDLGNPAHRVAKLVRSPRAFRLLPELNTQPKVYYLSEGDWLSEAAEAAQGGAET